MVHVTPEKGPTVPPGAGREKEDIRKKIFNHWNALDDASRKDRKIMVRDMAESLRIPESVIEQHLAEWEAGKTG